MNKIFIEQKKWFFVITFTAVIFGVVPVFASSPIPTPLCQISGVIKSVEFKDAYADACLKQPFGCPTDMQSSHPAQYSFDVSINSVSYVSGNASAIECHNMYSVGKVKKIFLNKDKVKSGDTFSVNQKISGIVRSFIDVSFNSYTLSTITQPQPEKPVTSPGNGNAISTIKSSSEISTMLAEQKQLNVVRGVELSSDEQQYTVTGYRNAKLFFFIPVSLKTELKINAANGNIKQIKKPWWAFLAR